jgi:hypothetical protein
VSTAVSYIFDIPSYFNYPAALNVKEAIPMGTALAARGITLVINSIFSGLAALIGWGFGGVLPGPEDLA